VGDVVGRPGRNALAARLASLKTELGADFCVANTENAAAGSGVTPALAEELLATGIDCLTSGDHIYRRKEILEYLATSERLLRPANYPPESPGRGVTVLEAADGTKVGVVNVQGRIFVNHPADCPFHAVDAMLERLAGEAKVTVVDLHAEATSEKIAMGHHLDGRVSVVAGTHTHVQTADECVLPGGTAYITDLGMTGPYRSILGREIEPVLKAVVTGVPAHFDVAAEDVRISGALVAIDPETGRATAIKRVREKVDTSSAEEKPDERKPPAV
jgi:metallophosphoesterase (TIGR00282 family)